MTCVQCTSAGSYVSTIGTGVTASTNSWQFGVWGKITSYATQYTSVFTWYRATPPGEYLGLATGIVINNTTIDGWIDVNGGAVQDFDTIIGGSYGGWFYVSVSHVAGTNAYRYRGRKAGESAITFDVTINSATELGLTEIFALFSNSNNDPTSTRLRSFWFKDSVLSDADTLTASASLSAPSGTNLTFLELDDHTVAGENLGTGADWSVTGTLTTEADQPDPSLAAGPASALFFGAFP